MKTTLSNDFGNMRLLAWLDAKRSMTRDLYSAAILDDMACFNKIYKTLQHQMKSTIEMEGSDIMKLM
jgi:hypothetical protein